MKSLDITAEMVHCAILFSVFNFTFCPLFSTDKHTSEWNIVYCSIETPCRHECMNIIYKLVILIVKEAVILW